MRGVSNYAARHVCKLGPLFEKVIPAVIADSVGESAGRIADFDDMGSVENYLPAVKDGGFGFLPSLGTGPDVGLHFGQDGKPAAKWAIHPLDADILTVFICNMKCVCLRPHNPEAEARIPGGLGRHG
jgi:hypothetical protein